MEYLFDLLSLDGWGLSPLSWGIFCVAVFIVGFSKTGLPGATIMAVPMMAMIIPAKTSVGVMLPVFIMADLISTWSWRRFARWHYCFPFIAFIALGVWGASFVAESVNDKVFGVVIGWTVLLMIGLSLAADILRRLKNSENLPPAPKPPIVHSAFFGLSTGLFSALANAAGPIVSLYMIISRLDKFQFLGTTAVCAFVMNWIKVPLFLSLGMISAETLKLDIVAIPMVVLGGLAGIVLAKKLSQKAFKNIVLLLAFFAALKLILS